MTGLYIIQYKEKYAKRQDIGQTSGKMHLIFKIKTCVIRYSKRFQTPWKWSILPVTCSALGDLNIYTKHIFAHDQHYYITVSLLCRLEAASKYMFQFIPIELVKGDEIVCDDTVTPRKHSTKHKNIQKWMVKVLRKFKNPVKLLELTRFLSPNL